MLERAEPVGRWLRGAFHSIRRLAARRRGQSDLDHAPVVQQRAPSVAAVPAPAPQPVDHESANAA
jgi:hypothetical protein